MSITGDLELSILKVALLERVSYHNHSSISAHRTQSPYPAKNGLVLEGKASRRAGQASAVSAPVPTSWIKLLAFTAIGRWVTLQLYKRIDVPRDVA